MELEGGKNMNANIDINKLNELYNEMNINITTENEVHTNSNEVVCNFIPRILGQKIVDGKHKLLISGIGINNTVLPSVLLDLSTIQKNRWPAEYFGFEYYVNKKNMEEFMKIIRQLCKYSDTRNIYNHTGWIIDDNKWSYIHANGCIGDAKVEVELEESINNYCLPDSTENLEEACRLSLQLCDALKDDKGIILQSLVYLSPLVDIINQVSKPPEMVVWLWGKTGSRKTSLARAYLSHFGDFSNKIPCTFNDTKTAVELKANLLKDTLCLCDDFAPKQDYREKKAQDSNAELILRMYGDRVAKGRSSNKLDIKNMNIPRGMMLVTGEGIISGESSNARLLSIDVNRESVNLDILTRIQKNTSILGEAMRGYIEWLMYHLNNKHDLDDTLENILKDNFEFYRDELVDKYGEYVHGRTIESISWLKIGFTCMLQYMVDINIIEESRQKSYEKRLDIVMNNLIDSQIELISSNSPVEEFLNTLKEAIDSNSIKLGTLNSKNQVIDDKTENMYGYRDSDYYYFYLDKIYSFVKWEQQKKGVYMSINQKSLVNQLREEGIVKSDSRNNSPKKVIHVKDATGKDGYKYIRPRLLHIERSKIDNFTYSEQ